MKIIMTEYICPKCKKVYINEECPMFKGSEIIYMKRNWKTRCPKCNKKLIPKALNEEI